MLNWNKYIFDQEMFGSAHDRDVLTSRTKSSYTPGIRRRYPERTGENRRKPCRICKKKKIKFMI